MTGHYGGDLYKWDGGANAPHINRYQIAKGWVLPDEIVLDAACCTGYGSHILSLSQAEKVIGYEVDVGCIESANNLWKSDKTEFHVKDLDTCELPECDVAVSLETIEHLNDVQHFVDELHKKVRRLIIACVPIGGTTWAYKDEPPSPGTEKTDFMNDAALDKIICPEGSGWKKQAGFRYGYSYYLIAFKKAPERK